ncbi:hypothetical protein SAMN05216174_104306 [Actinokineospora iranica]|uniref:Uncharacterized protein n=1 Tax=Actinokineospora iranica TaxID=1271860 RepID=A0A1G6PK09_9PSEU|nr:hypothetical protein SAMN05216174_104306 [Actinokineospora iranica]
MALRRRKRKKAHRGSKLRTGRVRIVTPTRLSAVTVAIQLVGLIKSITDMLGT